jgi:hypothetical protein
MGHNDEGARTTGRVIESLFRSGKGEIHGSDGSGWDLSVCSDALYFDAVRRISRIRSPTALDSALILAEAACNSRHVLAVDGSLFAMPVFGMTASGIPSTSAQNSPMRAAGLLLCGALECHTIGDDELHSGPVNYDLLATTGVITRDEAAFSITDKVDLTSHLYHKTTGVWIAEYNNLPKMFARLDLARAPGTPPPGDNFQGMLYALRHSPGVVERFTEYAAGLGADASLAPQPIAWEA